MPVANSPFHGILNERRGAGFGIYCAKCDTPPGEFNVTMICEYMPF